jgi:hypothetical protein
MLNMLASNTS